MPTTPLHGREGLRLVAGPFYVAVHDQLRDFIAHSRVPPPIPKKDHHQPIDPKKGTKRTQATTFSSLQSEGGTPLRRQHRPKDSPATCHPERVDIAGPGRALMVQHPRYDGEQSVHCVGSHRVQVVGAARARLRRGDAVMAKGRLSQPARIFLLSPQSGRNPALRSWPADSNQFTHSYHLVRRRTTHAAWRNHRQWRTEYVRRLL